MEFLAAFKVIISKNVVDLEREDCDKEILKAYSNFLETESDNIQFQEYKNIISQKCGNVSLVYELYKSYLECCNNNDNKHFSGIIKTIEKLADELEKAHISCFSYSYFMYTVLSFLGDHDDNVRRLGIEEIRWINPDNYDYSYTDAIASDEQTFGFGRFKESLKDFEFNKDCLVRYNGKNTYVIIPYFVKTIESGAFKDNKNIRLVHIPKNVRYIKDSAFEGCCNLETVNLSPLVNNLPNRAFAGCSLLKRINSENIETVGDECFYKCVKLTKVKFKSLQVVGNSAFEDCVSITDFAFVSNLKSIGERAFAHCQMQGVTLVNCDELGTNAFYQCSKLNMVSLDGPLSVIGEMPFEGCFEINLLTIRTELNVRPHLLFANDVDEFNNKYSNLETININNVFDEEFKGYTNLLFVTVLESDIVPLSCFEDCENLIQIVFSKEVAHISERAFSNCSSLSTLKLSFSGETIGCRSFYGCLEIKDFSFLDTVTAFEDFCLSRTNLTSFNFNRKYSKIGCFAFANSVFNEKFNLSLLDCKVYPGAFHGAKKIRRLEVSSLTNILPNNKLHTIFEKSVDLFSNEVTIDYLIIRDCLLEESFSGYANIRYIECDSNNQTITARAFRGCEKLEAVKISGNVNRIEKEAFSGCCKLSAIDMSYGELSIESAAFEGCGVVNKLVDFGKVIRVDERAFANSNIQKANFGFCLQAIEKGVFCNCFELKEIVLPTCDLLVVEQVYQGLNYLFLDNDNEFYINDSFGVESLTILSEELPSYALQGIDYVNDLHLPNLIAMEDLSLNDNMNLRRIFYGASIHAFSGKVLNNLQSEIQLVIDENCNALKSVNNSIFSKDGTELFYLSKSDDFGKYSADLRVIKSYAIFRDFGDFSLNKSLFLETNSINVANIGHLNIEQGVRFDNTAIIGLSNIERLTVDLWQESINVLLNGVLIKEAKINTLNSSLRNLEFDNFSIAKARLDRAAFDKVSIQNLEISNVEHIGAYAFTGAIIHKLVLRNAKDIKPLAFAGSNIKVVEIVESDGYVLRDGCLYNETSLIYCFDKSIERYVCGKGLHRIFGAAFEGCDKLEYFESIHTNISIDENVFVGCNNLFEIKIATLQQGVISRIFGSDKLKKIEFYGNKVPRKYFYKQNALETVVLHGAVEIADLAFANCRNLVTIKGLENIVAYGDYSFYNCSSIDELAISNSCNRIGLGTFVGCDSLGNILMPIVPFEIDNHITYKDVFGESGKRVVITKGNIPDQYFLGASDVESIKISSNDINSIGEYAFSGCTSLEAFAIPNTVEKIGKEIFSGCTNLTDLTLPYIGETKESIQPLSYLFGENCSCGLKEIIVTSSICLASRMFSIATSLEKITFNSNVTTIPDECFYNLYNLIEIKGFEKVLDVGNRAFYGCAKVSTLNLSNINKLGEKAFYKCSRLSELIINFIGESTKDSKSLDYLIDKESCSLKKIVVYSGALVKNTFKNYISLESINVKFATDTIPESCFEGLSNLTELILSPKTKVIEPKAFKNCSSIQSFDFNDVVSIGEESFYNTGIQNVLLTKKCTEIGVNAFTGSRNISKAVVALKGQNYLAEIGLSTKEFIEFTLISGELYSNIFNSCEKLEKVVLSADCKSIPDKAFSKCSKLQSIDISNIEILGEESFVGCKELKNVNLAKVLQIGKAAFKDSGVKDVILNDALKILPEYVFSGCQSLMNINIPKTLLEIGGYAFEKTKMKNQVFIMPASLKNVGSYVFYDADSPVIHLRKTQESSWSSLWGKSCKGHGLFWANHNVKVKYIKE